MFVMFDRGHGSSPKVQGVLVNAIVERMLANYYLVNLEVGFPIQSIQSIQSIDWESFMTIDEVIKSETFVVFLGEENGK